MISRASANVVSWLSDWLLDIWLVAGLVGLVRTWLLGCFVGWLLLRGLNVCMGLPHKTGMFNEYVRLAGDFTLPCCPL